MVNSADLKTGHPKSGTTQKLTVMTDTPAAIVITGNSDSYLDFLDLRISLDLESLLQALEVKISKLLPTVITPKQLSKTFYFLRCYRLVICFKNVQADVALIVLLQIRLPEIVFFIIGTRLGALFIIINNSTVIHFLTVNDGDLFFF